MPRTEAEKRAELKYRLSEKGKETRRKNYLKRLETTEYKLAQKKHKASLKARETKQNYRYKTRYGITYEEAKTIKSLGCCSCGLTEGRMNIDHCHKTGKIRGCLCNNCNVALGLLDDTPEKVYKLYEYILRSQA